MSNRLVGPLKRPRRRRSTPPARIGGVSSGVCSGGYSNISESRPQSDSAFERGCERGRRDQESTTPIDDVSGAPRCACRMRERSRPVVNGSRLVTEDRTRSRSDRVETLGTGSLATRLRRRRPAARDPEGQELAPTNEESLQVEEKRSIANPEAIPGGQHRVEHIFREADLVARHRRRAWHCRGRARGNSAARLSPASIAPASVGTTRRPRSSSRRH